jgi:predicted Rossmann fold nucleotide-binding protein DprA/Smf involved in DNA uptake
MIEQKIIAIVGSRDTDFLVLREVEKLVTELMKSGHYILSDGSKRVGKVVMETAEKIDPSRIYVYLHCTIARSPSNTKDILKKLPKEQIFQIPGIYSDRNIFYRNKLMVQRSDLVIAFWKNRSSGTQHVIKCCKKNDPEIPLIINEYYT